MNNIWIFGDSAGIDFNIPNNPVPIFSAMDGRGSCVSISDTSGQLQFYAYTNGNFRTEIRNALGDTMQNAELISGKNFYNTLSIVPFPNSNSKFYVFLHAFSYGLFYCTIDMNLDGGLGGVDKKFIGINTDEMADCLTAIKHGNGRDWWLIAKLSKQNPPNQFNRFFVYLITPDSIHEPILQDFNDAFDVDFQKIVIHPHQDKFMLINLRGYMKQFSFDRCDGTINIIDSIFTETPSGNGRFFWEGAYSRSGDVFYACITMLTTVGQDTAYLVQYDLTATDIIASADTLESWVNPIGPGAVRLAPDGKIYFSRAYQCNVFPSCAPYPDSVRNVYNENLSVINQPDSLGSACNYQPFSFYLGGKRTYYGLPNNPNYELGPLAGSLCDTITSVGIEPNKPSYSFNLYPNPAYNKVTLNISTLKPQEKATLHVYNNIGALLLQKEITLQTQSLDVTELPAGIYYIQVQTELGSATEKLIKVE